MPAPERSEAEDILRKILKAIEAGDETEDLWEQLRSLLQEQHNSKPLIERLQPVLKRAEALGEVDPDFDMKAFTDKMSE
ncbi:hypothetical protein [Ruegeria arenilitoris]|uniref:hypothetical protein n=1 Tax=Ruegeria arenilitoris TaxID=1173585 RepID=UPI00147D0388|nr:hypothetical protein [Ruegeria arenilitoris]